MNQIQLLTQEFDIGAWSHAYLILGKNEKLSNEIIELIISKTGCLSSDISKIEPEMLAGKSGEIKVDEIASLLHQNSLTPNGKIRISIIYQAEKLNSSSANILLKNLEEPSGDIIYILVANKDTVLKTIRSRCRVVKIPDLLPEEEIDCEQLLTRGFAAISSRIEEIIEKNEIEVFLQSLEMYFRKKLLTDGQNISGAIKKIVKTRKEISQNANPRLALESLILSIK